MKEKDAISLALLTIGVVLIAMAVFWPHKNSNLLRAGLAFTGSAFSAASWILGLS